MIHSDKQLDVTKRELAKLRDALRSVQAANPAQDWLREAESNALKSQIGELCADIKHYQTLKSGEVTVAKSASFEELPSVLVQARIISGMSQSDLAARPRCEASTDPALRSYRLYGCESRQTHRGLANSEGSGCRCVRQWRISVNLWRAEREEAGADCASCLFCSCEEQVRGKEGLGEKIHF